MGVQIFCETLISFPLDAHQEVKLFNHMVNQLLIFLGTSVVFSIVALTIYTLTNSVQGFPFLHILSKSSLLWVFFFFIIAILTGVR